MSVKNTLLPVQTLLQSNGRLLDISQPVVMGILNATPDSFYNKGKESTTDDLLRNAEKMINEGATILDIGGATTKPGSSLIDTIEEQKRIIPAIKAIHKRFSDTWLSIDTYNAETAKAAINEGAAIVNDISGGKFDSDMLQTVAALRVPYIAMHIQGSPETMQQNPQYDDVVFEVRDALRKIANDCDKAGITDVILDLGFGFGKTVEHNFSLLKNLHTLHILGKPILAGISRKSMICKTLNVSPENALNGTTAIHMIALQQGANILRVHDVKEAVETVKLWRKLQEAN